MAFKMANSLASPGISITLNKVKSTLQLNLKRALTVKPLTNNLKLITSASDVSVNGLVVKTAPRPLALVIPWLMAKRHVVFKYITFYTDQGFDVLVARTTPYKVVNPVPGTQVVARELAGFLQANTSYQPLVIHGFSVGSYVWGETMVIMNANLDQYQSTVDKFAFQIWDSIVQVEQSPIGIATSFFPNRRSMQKWLERCGRYYLSHRYDSVTKHHIRACDMFYEHTLLTAPALFMVSKTDPVGRVENVMRAYDNWRARGIEAKVKCWDDSPHVGHFRQHPQEYVAEWSKLMATARLLRFPDKFRASFGPDLAR